MSANKKCPGCERKSVSLKTSDFPTGIMSPETGDEIIVKSRAFVCKKCDYSWMSASDAENLQEQIAKATWQTLKPSEIAEIREALGFKTKTQAAQFLGLNAKAFSKWEQGYNPINFSTDLLLRLAAHSEDNVQFIKNLHGKQFKYEPRDYQTVCALKGEAWLHKKMNQTVYAFPNKIG